MRIMIVSDAWFPQTNGVVNTLAQTAAWLSRFGHEVRLATPKDFDTIACPTYPEIRVSVLPMCRLAASIARFRPQALHIATEGPLGFAARRYCLRHRLRFTTSYHTQFPQYLRSRWPIPLTLSYAVLRRFHGTAQSCMVSTQSLQAKLAARGFHNLVRWRRGVDTRLFRPRCKQYLSYKRPIAAYVGRIAIEKNVEAFLQMPWSGTKLVIGDGPEGARLQAQYPTVVYAGFRFGEDLAAHMAATAVLVFPSRTDTFGLVNLEAMAGGVPGAAYPVTGPVDVVQDGVTGALDTDLGRAAARALRISPIGCRERALQLGWDGCTREFENNLVACGASPLTRPRATACVTDQALT